MNQTLFQIALVVKDYEEALDFYCNKLNFKLLEDTILSTEKRWVVVSPQGEGGCSLLLAKASNESQMQAIGNQTGGRVFLFMHTDNLDRDYEILIQQGISILNGPRVEIYGKVLVFEDLYGNKWDLIEKNNLYNL